MGVPQPERQCYLLCIVSDLTWPVCYPVLSMYVCMYSMFLCKLKTVVSNVHTF